MRSSLLLLATFAVLAAAQTPVHRESTEWCDFWMPNTSKQDLPRVMLIGDSITRAYFATVEEQLKGKAYVARIATSKAIGDPALLAEISTFLSQGTFDVVHFNIGMHGWAYTEAEYRQHFPDLIATIRKHVPAATRLIWASTTPIRKDREGGASNSRIEARNRIARELATAAGIPVDDLHAAASSAAGDIHTDDIHFTKEGSAMLGAQVAAAIQKLLPPATPVR